MDISLDPTLDSPISDLMEETRPNTSSSSNTLSNHAGDPEELDQIVDTITKNMNSVNLTSSTTAKSKESTDDNETLDNRSKQQHKLTTVNSHPLMSNDSDSEDSYNNHKVNYPDVVPKIEQKHQPLRLANPAVTQKAQSSKRTTSTTSTSSKKSSTVDVVNSVNNNIHSSSKRSSYKKPIYREPSPVSIKLFKFRTNSAHRDVDNLKLLTSISVNIPA